MNKKLIALAVSGACVAPAAMAQSANPVTLYGRVYETLESVQADAGGGNPEVVRRSRITDQASLLGVRGTEQLSPGLQAFFQLETAFQPNVNGTSFAGRNSGVGLQGGWGSVVMGRWDMPYKVATYSVDAFGDLTLGGITGVGHDQGNFDRRDQNIVQYWSPDFAGFAFKLAWQASNNKTATTDPHDTGAIVTYTRGPVYAFLAYEDHKDPSAAITKERGYSGGAAVTFGPIKLGGEYEEIKRDSSGSNLSYDKRKSWLADVVWTVAGNNQLIVQYQDGKDGALTTVSQPECHSWTGAYKYIFSKRTFFIAQYTTVKNNDFGTCNFGSGALAIKPGNDPKGAAVGIQHIF